MLCPNCKNEMIVVERNEVELDYCPNCSGFWFDDNEWNILCKKLYSTTQDCIGDMYSIPKAIVNEKPKSCPICDKKMEKFIAYNIVLDRCPNHHGIWFDKNEVSNFINSANKTTDKNPIEFLGEVFFK